MTKNSRMSFAVAVLILLVAAFLRLSELTTLPPGYNSEELIDIRLTEAIRQGRMPVQVFYSLDSLGRADEGRDGLYPIMMAVMTAFTGSGSVSFHLLSVWLGMISLALIYALARRLYGDLAGVAAMGLLAFGMWPVLLSRITARETLLPLLVTAVLLTLALGFPVYWRRRSSRTQTTAFTALAVLVGLGFYVHPAGLLVALMVLLFVVFMLVSRQRLSRPTLSYTGFAALVALIVATPYLVSALRLPDLGGAGRLIEGFISADQTVLERVGGALSVFGLSGDMNPAQNIPGRPLFNPISAALILLGVVVAVRYARKPRYAMPVIALLVLLPLALFSPDNPNFRAFTPVLPVLALCFGLGVAVISRRSGQRRLTALGLALLFAFNIVWLSSDLFGRWADDPAVQAAYHSDLNQIALHLDRTADQTPSVICTEESEALSSVPDATRFDLLTWMMNRRTNDLYRIRCSTGLLMLDGGETQQVIFLDPAIRQRMDPNVNEWLAWGEPLNGRLPEDTVLQLNVAAPLANRVGRFTTTAPVAYGPEVAQGETSGLPPPIRMGNNLTFLGYEIPRTVYQQGEVMPVVTYWRADGPLPRDLVIFAHVLDDTGASPVANTDTISIQPGQLNGRDVFVQVSYVPLPRTLPTREYTISIGAYRARTPAQERLPILINDIERGNRLLLYRVRVTERGEAP